MTASIAHRPGPAVRHRRVPSIIASLAALILAVTGVQAVTAGPAAGDHAADLTPLDWNLVTINVLDHNGQLACGGCASKVVLYNDTYEWDGPELRAHNSYDIRVDNGVAVGQVPDGVYSIFASVNGNPAPDYSRISLLVELEVVIEDDTTRTLDARDAVLMAQPEVPESDMQVRAHSFSLCHEEWKLGSYACFPGFDGSGNTLVQKFAFDYYMTPFSAPELRGTYVLEQWTLADPLPLEPVPNMSEGQRYYSPTPERLYKIPLLYEDGVSAADLSERTFTADQFVEVPVHYHADKPGTLIGSSQGVTAPYAGYFPTPKIYFEPGEVTEYHLASDRLIWEKADWLYLNSSSGEGRTVIMRTYDAFPLAEAGVRRETEQLYSAPHRHGAAEANPQYWEVAGSDDFPAAENAVILATMTRGGPGGDEFFAPAFHAWNSGLHRLGGQYGGDLFDTSWRMWNTDTGIELDLRDDYGMSFEGMESGRAAYRLEQTDAYPDWAEPYFRTKPTATTVWTFESERSDAEIAPEYNCTLFPPGDSTVCQVQPLIQLRYELGLDTYNQAPAGQTYTIGIEARHHVEAVDAAMVKTITVQASFDDGRTWETFKARPQRGQDVDEGMFQVRIDHPDLADTNGFVGLRIQATDANGGTVDQYIERAYILK